LKINLGASSEEIYFRRDPLKGRNLTILGKYSRRGKTGAGDETKACNGLIKGGLLVEKNRRMNDLESRRQLHMGIVGAK